MKDEFVPSDQEQRLRLQNELDRTFFVEAGAGTGKTRELVWRLANLIAFGKAEVAQIAAITFTEAAAAELRDRVRLELEKRAKDSKLAEESARCHMALSCLDNASIQTLHSFAGALLREKPIEAGLPPNFNVVAEIEGNIDFGENWRIWLDEAMDNKEIAGHLFTAMTLGLKLDDLKKVAKSLNDNYDRLPQHFEIVTVPVRQAAIQIVAATGRIRKLISLAKDGLEDPLAAHAQKVSEVGDTLATMDSSSDAALAILSNCGRLSYGKGSQKNWNNDPATGINGCKELKGLLEELEDTRCNELDTIRRAALMPLLESLRSFVLEYVKIRKSTGKAQFHDLLVWARDMLRDNPQIREHFQKRFTHILIDEFQDTDPIQAEIAFFLAADQVSMGDVALTEKDWRKLKVAPGKLFVVGDPKQSIYRFRRADIATVQGVSALVGSGKVILGQNFRSQEPVIAWVNSVFGNWMATGISGIQAAYSGLSARWKQSAGDTRFGVYKFGGAVEGKAGQIAKSESTAIINTLGYIKKSGWKVRKDSEPDLRDAEFKDICVLMPSRNILPYLERVLDEANIPYRVESESFVLGTQDVWELLNCLRAIDSPADQVALVAALRSTAFGVSDVELVEFLDSGGCLDYTSPGTGNGPVLEALQVLSTYNRDRMWMPMDKLIERFIRDRCLEEISFGRPRPRERLRRLKLVVEQARAFAQVGESSLRAFTNWMEQQAEEHARMVEIPVPEADEDAVRIMTIHAAKGLEFPIVILAGIGSTGRYRGGNVIFDKDNDAVHVSVGSEGKKCATLGYDEAVEKEKEADEAEAVRLMYVAATRARDYLLLSLSRKAQKAPSKAPAAIIERIVGETGCNWHDIDCSTTIAQLVEKGADDGIAPETALDREQWLKNRADVIQRASTKQAVAATEIAHSTKDEAVWGEVYYRKGRGGTNLGRAVHSVLQTVDLRSGEGLEEISRAQAAAEGIQERWQEVVKLVRNALNSTVVKRAVASGKYYREVFVSMPLGSGFVEGFIDLLFEENSALVIADYKTDVLENEEEEIKRQDKYGIQAGTYALAITATTNKPVKEIVLVFLKSSKEISVSNVDEIQKEAREKALAVLK